MADIGKATIRIEPVVDEEFLQRIEDAVAAATEAGVRRGLEALRDATTVRTLIEFDGQSGPNTAGPFMGYDGAGPFGAAPRYIEVKGAKVRRQPDED